MTDNATLRALADAGVSDLARRPQPRPARHREPRGARRDDGGRRGDDEPVDLPGGDGQGRPPTTPSSRELAAAGTGRGRRLRDDDRRRPRRVRRPRPVHEAHRRGRRPGVDRGRPPARPRHRRDDRAGRGARRAPSTGRTCSSRSRPRSRACRPSPQVLGRGDQRQRHPHLLARPLPGRHGRLPRRARAGPGRRTGPVAIHSVASFFVSRVDTEVDRRLDAIGTTRGAQRAARARPAIANARLAYQAYEEVFATPRWQTLAAAGARPQRPLWASTGVKDPAYPDTMYVTELVAPRHGQHDAREDPRRDGRPRRDPRRHRHRRVRRGRSAVLDALDAPRHLLRRRRRPARGEGVEKFEKSWTSLLDGVRAELDKARDGVSGLLLGRGRGGRRRRDAAHVPDPRRRTGSPAGCSPRTTPSGARTPSPRPPSGCPGSACRGPRDRSSVRSRRCADELREAGLTRVVLCGMGGSSLAPEVICATAGVDLVVLDSSDPDVVRRAIRDLRLDRRRRVEQVRVHGRDRHPAARLRGTPSATPASTRRRHIVVVTDPGSPLDGQARAAGYRVVNADPDVGGRYSALTAFGLVPSGLAGADIEALLDDAEAVADLLAADDEANPALRLGAALGGTAPAARQARPRRRRHREPRASPPGPSSSSPSPPARTAPASSRSSASGPEPAHTYDDATVVRLLATDADDDRRRHAGRRRPWTSPARSAPSSSCGRRRPRSPAGCSGSTRSTSPTSRAPRPRRASLLEGSGSTRGRAGVHRRRRRGPGAAVGRTAGSVTPRPSAPPSSALLGQLDPEHGYIAVMAYLDREADARPRATSPATCSSGPAGRPPSAGARASSTRPASTTRAAPRPGVYLQVTGRPARRTSPSPAATSPSASSSPPRPAATPRSSPTTAGPSCGCTSPTTTPGSPRSAPRSAAGRAR